MCEILGDIRRLLNRRQLPKALQESALAVLDEKDPPLRITNDDRRHLANRQILLLRLYGIIRLRAVLPRGASPRERTARARRALRRADGRAQFHHRLVEVARHAALLDLRPQSRGELRARRQLREVVLELPHAGEDARNVAVDDGRAFAGEDRGQRRGGVRPDARQRRPFGGGAGPNRTSRISYHFLRGLQQISRPGVIPKPFPGLQNFAFLRSRQFLHRRELLEKAFVIRQHGGIRRLLHHDLGEPAEIGRRPAPPGHRPFHFGEPALERVRNHLTCAGPPEPPRGARSARGTASS